MKDELSTLVLEWCIVKEELSTPVPEWCIVKEELSIPVLEWCIVKDELSPLSCLVHALQAVSRLRADIYRNFKSRYPGICSLLQSPPKNIPTSSSELYVYCKYARNY